LPNDAVNVRLKDQTITAQEDIRSGQHTHHITLQTINKFLTGVHNRIMSHYLFGAPKSSKAVWPP
jgi:hypothetical protein